MHSDQWAFHQLHRRLLDGAPPADLLEPWFREFGDEERRWISRLRADDPRTRPPIEDLWRLYALSRVSDLLITSTQQAFVNPDGWNLSAGTASDHRALLAGLDLEPIGSRPFHPVFHEIVEVVAADDPSEAPSIVGPAFWDGFMHGPLVIARTGVRVRAGRQHVAAEVAERSRLYWSYARQRRPTLDLSDGWGHNSQWRTSFRRDLVLDGVVYFNVDADLLPQDEFVDSEVTGRDLGDLVRHRCLIREQLPDDDLWPWDTPWVEDLT